MKNLLLLIVLIIISSCTSSTLQTELDKVQAALVTTKADLAKAQTVVNNLEKEASGQLVHLVFFKVKTDADLSELVKEVKQLQAIEEVLDLEVGPFEDLGDTRALTEYSMLMQMSFVDKVAYETYQKHPIHLALKEKLGAFLVAPPATYDFIKK